MLWCVCRVVSSVYKLYSFPLFLQQFLLSMQYCPHELSCRAERFSWSPYPWYCTLTVVALGFIFFLSSILLHVSVDSHVLSVLLRYPIVFFAVLQNTSLIWFHFPFTCGWSISSVLIIWNWFFISTTNAFSTSSCLSLGKLYFLGLFFLGGSFP